MNSERHTAHEVIRSTSPVARGQLREFYNDSIIGAYIGEKVFIVLSEDEEHSDRKDPMLFWNCLLSNGTIRTYSCKAIELYSRTIE
jgi:hypothetical protein